MTDNSRQLSHVFVFSKTPFAGSLSRSNLDYALTLAAYEQQVSFLYLGEGVMHLLNSKKAKDSGIKDYTRILGSLDIYDINELYVEDTALIKYGLDSDQLVPGVQKVSWQQMSGLIERAHRVYFC